MDVPRLLTVGSAAAYAAIGLGALARPASVPALFGGTAPNAAARTETRAVYGGLPMALAVTIGWAARRPAQRQAAVVTAAAVSAGMAGGRLAGAAWERRLPLWPTGVFVALESALALALSTSAAAAGGGVADGRLPRWRG